MVNQQLVVTEIPHHYTYAHYPQRALLIHALSKVLYPLTKPTVQLYSALLHLCF